MSDEQNKLAHISESELQHLVQRAEVAERTVEVLRSYVDELTRENVRLSRIVNAMKNTLELLNEGR